jgi:dolichol-phosphate mannosyltransferase
MHRRVISTGARLLARPLTTVSDPMSGFFGIQKKYVQLPLNVYTNKKFTQASDLNPHGFKVALDLLLKSPLPINGITEVPFSFGTRKEGESKLTGKVMLRYLEQLGELYWWKFYGLILAIIPVFIVSIIAVVLQIYVNRDHLRIKYVLTGKQ